MKVKVLRNDVSLTVHVNARMNLQRAVLMLTTILLTLSGFVSRVSADMAPPMINDRWEGSAIVMIVAGVGISLVVLFALSLVLRRKSKD